jgi:hypothetical protein
LFNIGQHSNLKFVTPEQRHKGQDEAILKRRTEVYQQAKSNNAGVHQDING